MSGALPKMLGRGGYYSHALSLVPQGLWPLSEAGGTIAKDLSPNDRDGTYTGGFTLSQDSSLPRAPGQRAVLMNGTTGYVDVGTMGSFGSGLGSGASISVWYKSTSTAIEAFCGRANSAITTFLSFRLNVTGAAGTNTAGYVQCFLRDDNNLSRAGSANIGAAVYDGLWHHIVGTITPSAVTIYFDGVNQTVGGDLILTPTTFSNFSASMFVGANNNAGTANRFFDGTMDRVALFNSVLTQSDATALYLLGLNGAKNEAA